MRQLFYILLIFCFSISGIAQDMSPYEQEQYEKSFAIMGSLTHYDFEESLKSSDPEVVKSSLAAHQKVIDSTLTVYAALLDSVPHSKLRNSIQLNTARMYDRHGSTALAKTYYLKALDNPAPFFPYHPELDNSERNTICLSLARLLIKEKNYQLALQYLDTSKKYALRQPCGNGQRYEDEKLEAMYRSCREAR